MNKKYILHYNAMLLLMPSLIITLCININALQVGKKAPNFSLKDQNNNIHTLDSYKGKKVALFFYPADNSAHCTEQACSIRDGYSLLQEAGIVVLGLNDGNLENKKKFATKHHLPFPLLNATSSVLTAYKTKGIFFTSRITYLINEDGIIIAILKDIDTHNHAQQIFDQFKITAPVSSIEKQQEHPKSTAIIYLHELESLRAAEQTTLYKLINNNKQIIIIFYEDWCGPCKRMAPILEELAQELPDVIFVKVKRELYRPLFDELIIKPFQQSTVPSMIFYNNGQLVNHQLSSATKEELHALIKKTYKLA